MSLVDDRIAEAGQEILEGPYEECVYCEGAGTHRVGRGPSRLCSSCDGSGKKIRRQYHWACDLLGYQHLFQKALQAMGGASDHTKKALKRREDMDKLERIQTETKKKWGNTNQSLEEILKRVAANGNYYYGRDYQKKGKV